MVKAKQVGALDIMRIGVADALVVVDMEKDFCHRSGALLVSGVSGEPSMESVTRRIKHLAKLPFGYRAVTFDRHPISGHVEFHIYGRHVIIGSSGADYVRELEPIAGSADFRLVKGGDKALISHSAAVSPDWGKLIGELRERHIQRIFVCHLRNRPGHIGKSLGWVYVRSDAVTNRKASHAGF